MNRILILVVGLIIISCDQNKKESPKTVEAATELTVEKENFNWLLGKWQRNNEKEGKETFENWSKNSDTEYVGLGFTMQNGDTIKQEKIKLVKLDNNWRLEVKLPEEPESIIFEMIGHTEVEFTCENKENDFPNLIKYWKNDDKINATVSGGEMEISFEFEKVK